MHCNIGFAELAVNMPNPLLDETVPVLIDILRDVPYIDFDRCLAWDGTNIQMTVSGWQAHEYALEWALPDQLVSATVSALLRIASSHSQHRESATGAIANFVQEIVLMLTKGDCTC